jgi:dihydroorotase
VRRLLDSGRLSLTQLMDKLVVNPRRILKLPVPEINVGAVANLTVFNTDESWNYTRQNNKSKSVNSPYLGKTMKGRAVAIYNRHRFVPAT